MSGQDLWAEAKLCVTRTFTANFQKGGATERERRALESAATPVVNPLAQSYAVWRRATLWVAAASLVGLSLIELFSHTSFETTLEESNQQQFAQALGESNLKTIDSLLVIMMLSTWAAAALAVVAALRWSDLKRSRRFARLGWLFLFITPLVLSAIPVTSLLDLDHIPSEQRATVTSIVGVLFGLGFFVTIAPKALSLFPGIIRSSMTLKTLLPESAVPGWASVLVAPLYAIFLLVVLTLLIQSGGSLLLLAGILCLMAAPAVYLWHAKDVLRPHTPEEANKIVGRRRSQAMLFNLGGFALIGIYILDSAMFDFWDLLKLVFSIEGSVWLLCVISSDLLLALLRTGHEQSRDFHGSELYRSLDEKFAGLKKLGLTDLRTK
jgi:hypothetical protein